MQGGRGGRGGFFPPGSPFAGFGGFGGPGSLVSNFFGGRDPFDDPFFSQPFGNSMFSDDPFFSRPFGSMLGPSMFGSSPSMFSSSPAAGFIEHVPPQQQNKSRGPIIEELNSDDEEEGKDCKEEIKHPRKHSRSNNKPLVEDPDDEAEDRRSKQTQFRRDYNRTSGIIPQAQTFSFQSSTVTLGGVNGAYYTSSTTRRMGGDGVVVEESKEADSTTGKATHRLSRGIRDKGHSLTRKLNSDRRVDTVQTLHNLNEDELPSFEEAWKGSARKHLPGWEQGFNISAYPGSGASSSRQIGQGSHGWALPSTEQPQGQERMTPHNNMQHNFFGNKQERTRAHVDSKRSSFNGRK